MLFVTNFSCSIFSKPCISSNGLICLLWTGHFQNTNGHIVQVRRDKTSDVFLLSLQRPVNLNLPSLSWQGCMGFTFILRISCMITIICWLFPTLVLLWNIDILAEFKLSPPTGHEDATEDFGIYEFVSIPGKMESTQVERAPRCVLAGFACFSAEADSAELRLNFSVCLPLTRRRRAGPSPVWSRPRTCTPPSMTSSDTFQRCRVTVCSSNWRDDA